MLSPSAVSYEYVVRTIVPWPSLARNSYPLARVMPESSDLTPVRIRGKKQQSRSVDATTLNGTYSQPSSPLPGRSRRTHKGLLRDVGPSSSQPNTTSATSPLERLPPELLEDIFFRCLNLSLPRASLALGQQLASYHVKSKLYALAFSGVPYEPDDEDGGHRLEAVDFLIGILMIGEDGWWESISKFQSDILALKWMTPAFLRQIMDRLLVKKTVIAFNELGIGWIKSEKATAESASPESLTEAITAFLKAARSSTNSTWSSIDRDSGKWCYEAGKEKVSFDLGFHQSFPHLVIIKVNTPSKRNSVRGRVIGFHQLLCCHQCRIPQKILHGPWSIPKCAMLAQLAKSECGLDRSGSTTDEEVASQGLKDAIAESSLRTIITLVGSRRNYQEGCQDPRCCVCAQDDDWKCTGIVWESHVGVPVTTEHLKFALDNNSSFEVLECLVDATNIHIDWRNEAIQKLIWENG